MEDGKIFGPWWQCEPLNQPWVRRSADVLFSGNKLSFPKATFSFPLLDIFTPLTLKSV